MTNRNTLYYNGSDPNGYVSAFLFITDPVEHLSFILIDGADWIIWYTVMYDGLGDGSQIHSVTRYLHLLKRGIT